MMELETILIAIIVSLSCSLCGVFLVLRRMSLMSDAISHSILLGIVLGYFLSKSLSSSVPVIGAVFAGMASVLFTELLQKTRLVKSDAAIGLVFPAMFSAGVILVSLYAGNVHLDIDAVLLGEIGLAPLDRIMFFGVSVPRSMVSMGAVLLLNLVFLTLFFKELKISTFDPGLSKSLGFSPTLINYGLMLAVSITCVGSFDSVGAVLVIALMITPSAAALLLTDDLLTMLILAGLLASLSAISGFFCCGENRRQYRRCYGCHDRRYFLHCLFVFAKTRIYPQTAFRTKAANGFLVKYVIGASFYTPRHRRRAERMY
ncbi:metal ABC transporter permease [Treponema phagedenis]|uniref:metal ABC transporter permease n=1 Tax=Treponema phagedenis TaxID=162 RepID=UPI0025AF3AFD|nr:metal ABC transporter permease [Treponema phagedenis]